jgi:hypothetical protein
MYYRVDLQAQFEARIVLAESTAAEKAGHQRAILSSRRMAEVNRLRLETAHFVGFSAALGRRRVVRSIGIGGGKLTRREHSFRWGALNHHAGATP